MSNYTEYRDAVGIKNVDMIRAVRTVYKKYSGATNAMVNHPESYGVCLLPEAEKLLADRYGYANGLNAVKEKPVKKAAIRKKPNRLSVYLTDEMYEKIKNAMKQDGCDTVQDFLLRILEDYLGG